MSNESRAVDVSSVCDGKKAFGSRDEKLVFYLEKYVSDLENGKTTSPEEFARCCAKSDADLRDELLDCLEGVKVIHAAVESVRDREQRVSGQCWPTAALIKDSTPSEALDSPEIAPRFIGDYRLIREIGHGGMGVVYEAEEQSLCRRVALKVLPFAAVLDQRQITRFRNEAQSAASLHHAHIVPVYAIGQERGVHYYAMQYIEGRSLSQAIAGMQGDKRQTAPAEATTETAPVTFSVRRSEDSSAFSQPSCVVSASRTNLGKTNRTNDFFRATARLAADAADALQHAHELGVVHRDIKPSNLLIDEQGKVWVADFGLARMQSAGLAGEGGGVTATGDIVGTLRYMSPEQARGCADQIDGRTDVYALGATLYELLTLEHAQPGNDRRKLLDNLERHEPIAPRRHNPAIPSDLENIVLRAMEKDRAARYASAAELRDDLQCFLDGRPTIARPATLAERTTKWARRHQRLVGVATAALAVVAVVATASALWVNQARLESEAALASTKRSLIGAFGVLDRFGSDLSDQLAATPGTEAVRREALQNTLEYYRYFLKESDDDARLTASAAQTRVHAAAVAERLGQTEEAKQLYEEAAASLEKLVSQSPTDRENAGWLARCQNNFGLLLSQQGEAVAGRKRIDRAVSLRRGLCEERVDDIRAMSDLAAVLSDRAGMPASKPTEARSDLDEAIALLARVRRAAPEDRSAVRRLAVAHNALASLLRAEDPTASAQASERAIELLRRLVTQEPAVDAYRDDLAIAHSNRGALAAESGRWDDASQAYGEAAAELQRLALRSPLVPRRRSELAIALASRGFALARANRPEESDRAFVMAEKTLRGLVASYPQTDRYQRSLAALLNNRGVALRDSQRLDEAAIAFAKSVRLEEERLKAADRPAGTLLAVHYANHAQVLGRLGRFEEAAEVESKRQALLDNGPSQHADAEEGAL